MVLTTLSACVFFIFCLIFFVDFMLKSCMVFPYVMFLEDRGLSIKPFVIQWETTRFNRLFRRLGLMHPRFLRKWFQAGVLLVSIGVIPVIIMLTVPIMDSVSNVLFPSNPNVTTENTTPLTLIIPGVNIPFAHLLYIFIVTFISVIVHEAGHAIAASRERVFPTSSGLAIKYFMPIAYVNLPSEQLNQLSDSQKMRIFSAGIWHNVILGLIALLFLTTNTWILAPLYHKDHGVTVVHVNELSGASLPGGFVNDDQITFVDDCKVDSPYDWKRCFENMMNSPQRGYCTSENFVKAENSASSTRVEDCCGNDNERLCFKHTNFDNNNLMCLPGRKVAEHANTCYNDKDCPEKLCVVPVFSPGSSERFIKIFRRYKRPIFFVGSIRELYTSVTVSEWISKYPSISIELVVKYELFLKFFVALSASMALINLVPCYGFDGQFLTEVYYWIGNNLMDQTLMPCLMDMEDELFLGGISDMQRVFWGRCVFRWQLDFYLLGLVETMNSISHEVQL